MKSKDTFCAIWMKALLASALLLAAGIASPAQQRNVRKASPRNAIPAASTAPEQKYKGIWEPVNYPDDIEIKSVFFVNENEGWAAGKGPGGFIMHTTDGGENWEIQLGELNSTDKYFNDLLFLDQKHGWAVQDKEKLVRTSDGIHWEDAGVFPQFIGLEKYTFTSPRNGLMLSASPGNSQVQVTRDGSRTWKKVFQCLITLQIEGLTKKLDCHLFDMHFPSARVGYAAGGGFNGGYAVVAKTEDGGTTWKIIFATTEMETVESVFFTDENKGIIELKDHRVFATADGGQTWRGIPFSLTGPIRFSDPEVGVSCERTSCGFTADGGEHWLSRDFRFPAHVKSFSIPRRDRIYVVGDHGMVYRYRVVPADYMAKGSIDAPLLSSYGGAVNAQLGRLKDEVQQLQTTIASAGGASSSTAPATRDSSGRNTARTGATPAGQPQNQIITAQNQPGTGAEAQPFSQDSGAGGGFSQDATNTPTGADSQNAAGGSGFFQDSGFSQDVLSAPPSQPLQDCCSAQVQSLQTDLNSFSQQVPAFAGKYRNLNLLFVGLNMLSDLMGKARNMRSSFLALKQARDLPAAAAALQDLAAKLDSTSQAVSSGFQNLTASSSGPGVTGAVGNMLADPGSTQSAQYPNAAGTQIPDSTEQQKMEKKKNSAAEELKKKLKRRLPF